MNNDRTSTGPRFRLPGGSTGFALLLACSAPQIVLAANWPNWRGPNRDGSYTLSTPAFVDGEIFVRTATHLYCISR